MIVDSEVADDVVQVDQELRNALGAERQEYLKAEPAQVPQNRFADKVLKDRDTSWLGYNPRI